MTLAATLGFLENQLENVQESVRLQKPLLTDFDGTRIVAPKGLFRVFIWQHYWSFWANFTEVSGTKEKRPLLVLNHIKTLYADLILKSQPIEKKYLDYLEGKLNITKTKEARIHLQRLFFLFKKVKELKKTPYTFQTPSKTLKKITRLALFEGILQKEIPIPLIKKIFSENILTKGEEEEIKSVTASLKKSTISLKELHKTVIALHFFLSPKTPLDRIFRLESYFAEQTPELFKEKDEKQIKWVASLKEGDLIERFQLAEEILQLGDEAESKRIFHLKHDKNLLFLAPINRVLLPLRLFFEKQEGAPLKTPKWHSIDPEGRFAIFEKFPLAVKDLIWESQTTLLERDKKYLKPFIQLTKWCLKEKVFLFPLHLKQLYFDKTNTLRSLKLTKFIPLDLKNLDSFLKELSQGNPFILKYLEKEVLC